MSQELQRGHAPITTARGDNAIPSLNIAQRVAFSSEQNQVSDLVVHQGKSVFFTGAAGTGKSVLLRQIISRLKAKYEGVDGALVITASTGIAACHIGGQTLHSFADVGHSETSAEEMVKRLELRWNWKALTAWRCVKVLIIDEISMVDGSFLDKLEQVATRVRSSINPAGRPFGGIQLVVTGDFFQLPPVNKILYAFQAQCWSHLFDQSVILRTVFRQADAEFISVLNNIRVGKLDDKAFKMMTDLARDLEFEDGIEPMEL